MNFSFVIPGRGEAASPESITTIVSMDSGLATSWRPGMTTEFVARLYNDDIPCKAALLDCLRFLATQG